MFMNILEEFWYGNIEPAEYDISSSKEYKELLQLISRNKDKLLATMTDEQKELFTKYADCVREYQVIIAAVITLKLDCVLGLATGSSPVGTYQELIKKYTDTVL